MGVSIRWTEIWNGMVERWNGGMENGSLYIVTVWLALFNLG